MKGLTLYQSRKKSWNWLAIQVRLRMPRPFVWDVSTGKNWHSTAAIFPLFFIKNNSHWEFGIFLIFFTFSLKYQF